MERFLQKLKKEKEGICEFFKEERIMELKEIKEKLEKKKAQLMGRKVSIKNIYMEIDIKFKGKEE